MTAWQRVSEQRTTREGTITWHGWRLPGETHPSGALRTPGRLVTDFAIRTYGAAHMNWLLTSKGYPPLPGEAETMARFPVVPPAQIGAEAAADVHRLTT